MDKSVIRFIVAPNEHLIGVVLKKLILITALIAAEAMADDFAQCLTGLQEEARNAGVDGQIVEQVVPGLKQQQRVLELDRKQPEFVQTFGQYLNARVTEYRVGKGREIYRRYRSFLDGLTREYGVPGQYLVAFWGLETNFGSYLGRMPTLDSLATLACDPRRSKFFTTEFINALHLMHREDLSADELHGSWAGAVGHTQFMPSSYLKYAVDGDGDGKINLWQSEKDALASGANFLKGLGWQRNLRWGREVALPKDFPYLHAGRGNAKVLSAWDALGVTQTNKWPLPKVDVEGAVLVPAGHQGPAFLVYENFSVIMGWNRSESYALSVGLLADRIAGGGTLSRPPPADQQPLSRVQVVALQEALNQKGYSAGAADGIFGPATREALGAFEQDVGLIGDGFPDEQSIERLIPDDESQMSE